jgi:hypothetical protein
VALVITNSFSTHDCEKSRAWIRPLPPAGRVLVPIDASFVQSASG